MAAAFVLLFQNERAIHRERIFRDRTQNLDTLSDSELICRYRFPRQSINSIGSTCSCDTETNRKIKIYPNSHSGNPHKHLFKQF